MLATDKSFYTLKGYEKNTNEHMTPAMEDYLEMIFRITEESSQSPVRVGNIAEMLHVKPSSVSKMILHLQSCGYVRAEKYGFVLLTEKGKEVGLYLLQRHRIIYNFLAFLNNSDNELKEVERIEHFVDRHTVKNLELLTCFMKENNWSKFSFNN